MEFQKRLKLQIMLTSALLMVAVTFLCTFFALAAQKASIGASISIVYYSPSYILPTGSNFKNLIPGECTAIIFDHIDTYPSIVSSLDGTGIATTESGRKSGVTMYYDETNTTTYILADKTMFFNSNSSQMFNSKPSLKIITFNNINTSMATEMTAMFAYSSSLKTLDLSDFDTKNVKSMSSMFFYCTSLESLDISSFNTGEVTSMNEMFYACGKLKSLDVSNFDTSNVKNMQRMFQSVIVEELDLATFNTANVTNMSYMFSNCSELKTIYVSSNWKTDAVTTSTDMFASCTSLIGEFGTVYNSSYETKSYARLDTTTFPGYLTNKYSYTLQNGETLNNYFNISATMIVFGLYSDYESNISGLSGTNVDVENNGDIKIYYNSSSKTNYILSNGTIMANASCDYMFTEIYNIDLTIVFDTLNTGNVTSMEKMFFMNLVTKLDLSIFNTANVTNMTRMFCNCTALTTIYVGSGWNTDKVTSSTNMFYKCSKLVGKIEYTSSYQDKTYANTNGYLTLKS